MKKLFTHSLVVRLALLLVMAAPLFSACNTDSDIVKRAREREEEYKKIDDALIQDYFKRKGITAGNYQRTESGIYIVKLEEGPKENPLIKAGQTVQVQYIGSYMREQYQDQVFDKSFGNRTLCECLEVLVGAGQVVKAWEQVLPMMKLGDKWQIYFPSYLGYGQTFSGTIPSDEPLQFFLQIKQVR